MQNVIKICLVLSALFLCAGDLDATSYSLNGYGRKIQLDGFLLEWNSKIAHIWGSDSQFIWDAINTPEGIAGYIHSKSTVSCKKWNFSIKAENSSTEALLITVNKDSLVNQSSMYQIDLQSIENSGVITVEWLLPWNMAGVDSTGKYQLTLKGFSACGDSLQQISMTGSSKTPKTTSVWKGAAIRVVAIAALSVIFIMMRGKIRRKRDQKRSPHQ
jgi:hypothetical protein